MLPYSLVLQHVALREGKGRWCQASGTRQATLWQPRTGQEEGPESTAGVPCQICRAAGVQVGRQARPGCGLAVESSAKALPFCAARGCVRVHFHRVCFPVSVHRPPPPFRERSARISSPWAGGQGKRKLRQLCLAQPLLSVAWWPHSLARSGRGSKPPPQPSSGLHPHSLPCDPLLLMLALTPLITVTRRAVPWDGGWGVLCPRPEASPWGLRRGASLGSPAKLLSPRYTASPRRGRGWGGAVLVTAVSGSTEPVLGECRSISMGWGVGEGRAWR